MVGYDRRMLPAEREVDCACEVPLARPVGFEPTGRNTRVTACLRCGVVTVVEAIVAEPRPHDVRCVGNVPLELAPKLLAWLAAWPRVGGSHRDWKTPFFLPASQRAPDEATLETSESEERAIQAELSLRQRLSRAGVPRKAAPARLSPHLRCFMEVWEGLRLDASTPYEAILPHIETWARPFALELLEQRPTFTTDVAELLRSTRSSRRTAGAELVLALRLAEPEILDALAHWLDKTPIDARDLHRALDAAITLDKKAGRCAPPSNASPLASASPTTTSRNACFRSEIASPRNRHGGASPGAARRCLIGNQVYGQPCRGI
jgi:hypothetical protein